MHAADGRVGRALLQDTLEKPSSHDIQIDLDVPRTISGHVMFRTRYGLGQRALFHVLHAFSLLCPDCGYVQGMGPIAATLLCYYEPEKVYAVLVHTRGRGLPLVYHVYIAANRRFCMSHLTDLAP